MLRYREEGGSSLALQFDLGAPDRICTGVFLVKAGEILGVDETAFLESPLFLASQYNMWHISSDASTILWTDFYDDVHMTFDNTVYNLEECMVPAAVFKNEYMVCMYVCMLGAACWWVAEWVVLCLHPGCHDFSSNFLSSSSVFVVAFALLRLLFFSFALVRTAYSGALIALFLCCISTDP